MNTFSKEIPVTLPKLPRALPFPERSHLLAASKMSTVLEGKISLLCWLLGSAYRSANCLPLVLKKKVAPPTAVFYHIANKQKYTFK